MVGVAAVKRGGVKTPAPAAGYVHGMCGELTVGDWAPLTRADARAVLGHYGDAGDAGHILWRSPRPFSSAALVSAPQGPLFIKRHHSRLRTEAQLGEEHAFAQALAAHGIPVPDVLRTADGRSAVTIGEWTYEIQSVAAGHDLYRDALSWSPFMNVRHAAAAGRALALLHRASAHYDAPRRQARALVARFHAMACADPIAAVRCELGERPDLASYLAARRWEEDLAAAVLPFHRRLLPLLPGLRSLWTHNDFHASNLLWSTPSDTAEVAAIIDFGLSDRTTAMFDLATAIERNTIPWLDIQAGRGGAADLSAVDALVGGYAAELPLTDADREALVALLPIVHVDFALAEIEYFHSLVADATNADAAYDAFLIGHCRWFETPQGAALLAHLGRPFRRRPPGC